MQGVPITELEINHTTGAPGSFFELTGAGFPIQSNASISINGQHIGTIPVEENGAFTFSLSTPNADAGRYFVTASVNPAATVSFLIETTATVHPKAGEPTIFEVPAGLGFSHTIFIPLVGED